MKLGEIGVMSLMRNEESWGDGSNLGCRYLERMDTISCAEELLDGRAPVGSSQSRGQLLRKE